MSTKSSPKAKAEKAPVKKIAKKCACKRAPKVATQSVTFTVHAEKGKAVYLAGEFNAWDPVAKKMVYKAKSGLYAATLKLAPGTYQYKFIIDGIWCADPENTESVPNDQGTFNSVITVR